MYDLINNVLSAFQAFLPNLFVFRFSLLSFLFFHWWLTYRIKYTQHFPFYLPFPPPKKPLSLSLPHSLSLSFHEFLLYDFPFHPFPFVPAHYLQEKKINQANPQPFVVFNLVSVNNMRSGFNVRAREAMWQLNLKSVRYIRSVWLMLRFPRH